MAQVIYGKEQRLLPWAQERIGCTFRRDAYTIGLEKDGELVAVVVFDGFSACDCNVHVASDGTGHWLTREFLVCVFAYPFIQLGLRRVTGLIAAKNQAALRFNRKLGFTQEGVCRHGMPDDDLVVLGMLRSECRFLQKE